MEAAAVNTVPPGGKALVLNAGYFAARWAKICKAYGINAVSLDTEWGQPVDPDRVADALREHPDTACVMGTLSETSTGTGHPVEAIGRVVPRPTRSSPSTASRASARWSAAPTTGGSTCSASARRRR